ncbi:MAG: hypothetical protein WD738_11875 [Pirellulales bacterium]
MSMLSEYSSVGPRNIVRCVRAAAAFILGMTFLCASPVGAQQEDLSPLFQRASEEFRPVTAKELADARSELVESMERLERFVRPSSPNGRRWLRYLRWNELKEALAAEGPPNLGPLATTYRQLNRDEEGLELPRFRRVSIALLRYIQLAQLAQQPDQEKYYRSQLERLQAQLDEYRREPSPNTGFQIGSRLGFLDAVGQAPELVQAIRREFAQPNAFIDVATSLVADAADPIDRREWITDCILGTNIRSDAHTVGDVGVASIPSEDKAVLDFVSNGRTKSYNIGNNGPAVIHSTSYTDFTATKRVELTDEAFRARSSRADATTDTHIHSVAKRGGGLGSRFVANVGSRRARQSEGRAEAIAADHAEDRIDRRFNNEVNDEIREARQRYEEEYRRPLERRGELPEYIRFSSDKDSLGMEATQASRGQLGAAGPPPEAPAGNDVTMRLHESAVNNYSASLLGGATARETEPGQEVQFDVELPDWMKDAWEQRKTEATDDTADGEESFKPWSLRFRDNRPLTVTFVDGKVRVTIHISRLRSGDRAFSNWDVTAEYKPELADGSVMLRRDSDLVILPADFRGTLSIRKTGERKNLEEELNERSAQGRGFPRTIEFGPLEPEGALAEAGPLDATECESGSGWLTLAWSRQQSDE